SAVVMLAFAANAHAAAADEKDEAIRKLQERVDQLAKENAVLLQTLERVKLELAELKKIAADRAAVAEDARKREAEARDEAQRALELAKKQIAKFEDQLAVEVARARDQEAKVRKEAERAAQAERAAREEALVARE